MVDISYPFRKAAWHGARVLTMQSDRHIMTGMAAIALAITGGVIGGINTSPDDTTTATDHDARISAYEQQINELSVFKSGQLQQTRDAWRTSALAEKDAAETTMNMTQDEFQQQAIRVLAGLFTEEKLSEQDVGGLLDQFETKMGEVSSYKFNDNSFSDIGDAAFLREAQALHTLEGDEIERAFEIAATASHKNRKELTGKALSPMLGFVGGLVYMLLMGLTLDSGALRSLDRIASGPAPKKQKSGSLRH